MFWIYPGAFHTGDSGSTSFGPDFFMDREIVLVTSNHRLGIFGIILKVFKVYQRFYKIKN